MANERLLVTLAGEGVGENGVPVDVYSKAITGVQDAVRRMVEHLGHRETVAGRRPNWVTSQSGLNVVATRSGSFVTELELARPSDAQPYFDALGETAIAGILDVDESKRPRQVNEVLRKVANDLPSGVVMWLGNSTTPRTVKLQRSTKKPPDTDKDKVEARLFGKLLEVNWDKGTAQLHRYGDSLIKLRFDPSLGEEMQRHATKYVEITGTGRINANDRWTTVKIETVQPTRTWDEPFDLEAFLNDPNPKMFSPASVPWTREPFDVVEFIKTIHDARQENRIN